MKTNLRVKRLMIFVDETDKFGGKNLSIALVEKAKQMGCGGATVLRGIIGFGSHKVVHTSGLVDLAASMPEVVLVMDSIEIIDKLLIEIDGMIKGGLILVDEVDAIKFSG